MSLQRLLVVDDEPHMIWLLKESFLEEYDVLGAANQEEALAVLKSHPVDLVILDLRLDNEDGVTALKQIKQKYPCLPVIIITAYASIPTAVETLKSGACDYITKPFNIEEMRLSIKRALGQNCLPGCRVDHLSTELLKNKIVATSRKMLEIWQLVQKVAPTEANVLILGESGTGKELIARAIHAQSPRRAQPFIAVNCAALPENLLESELFGYEEGAFTGARGRKPGKFELAHKGSLLLDEVGDMALNTQVKILRVLEEKMVDRLGSTKPTPVDVRIIASTNKDIFCQVIKEEFREDLYYRLAVFPIRLPPLRERKEDIPLLARHFLSAFAGKYGKSELQDLHPGVMEQLTGYDWPGNVRELRNVIEQMVIMADGPVIKPQDIAPLTGQAVPLPQVKEPVSSWDMKETRDRTEVKVIKEVLSQCDGNRTRAAKMLGISRRTLQLKIKKYNLK